MSNLRDKREKHEPRINLGHLVRTFYDKRVSSENDSTNWSYKLYKITEIIHYTISSYKINYLPGRLHENLLRSTDITLDENFWVME